MYINVRRERHAQRKHVPGIYTVCVKNVDNIHILLQYYAWLNICNTMHFYLNTLLSVCLMCN